MTNFLSNREIYELVICGMVPQPCHRWPVSFGLAIVEKGSLVRNQG